MTATIERAATQAARRVRVTGVVQGVGFRPFVYRVATELGLRGWVRNRGGEVEITVEGMPTALSDFLGRLEHGAPLQARIASMNLATVPLAGMPAFSILDSDDAPEVRAPVPPDIAICPQCETELFDPANRRFRYPFITCTDCGPRYSIIEALPYDRLRTSMRAFAPCARCLAEYRSPADRRHHSQTNSCPACGPTLWYEATAGRVRIGGADAALHAAAAAVTGGAILALRGLGGFHLAVAATNESAVVRLRERKRREAKPLAVMVRTVEEARRLAWVSTHQARLLAGAERPIVLLRAADGAPLARSVAPGLDTIGVMLAYTPLHHLLLDLVGEPLVMTSGNWGDAPIIADLDAARRDLGGIADGLLLHDREIVEPIDDSVVRVVGSETHMVRRARGFASLSLGLPVAAEQDTVALGAHQKSTVAVGAGSSAWVSPHIGDLDTLETLERYRRVLADQCRLYRVRPRVIVRDAHPTYASTTVAYDLARELEVDDIIVVQHHHAHIAAVLAEHGVTEPVIGVAYDGTGYGADGRVWGGELLLADLAGYIRLAHLPYVPLPGGELAIRHPWRTVVGYLAQAADAGPSFRLALRNIPTREQELALMQARRGVNAPLASSMGRLFDAAAAVIGLRQRAQFEGQAAMELEALAGRRGGVLLPIAPHAQAEILFDPLPWLIALGERAQRGDDRAMLAAAWHDVVARATAAAVGRACEGANVKIVALSGGVFQNARLVATLTTELTRQRLRVLTPRRLPPNDGGVSYGQVAVAAAVRAAGLGQPRTGRGEQPCA